MKQLLWIPLVVMLLAGEWAYLEAKHQRERWADLHWIYAQTYAVARENRALKKEIMRAFSEVRRLAHQRSKCAQD